ncbi:MAG: hypothetical protein ACLURV_08925 [Gallintestinimicrobium sp.]
MEQDCFRKKRGRKVHDGKREKTAALSKSRQQGGLQKAALYFWKHKYLYLMLLPAILYTSFSVTFRCTA